jgi:hypothetical protein
MVTQKVVGLKMMSASKTHLCLEEGDAVLGGPVGGRGGEALQQELLLLLQLLLELGTHT